MSATLSDMRLGLYHSLDEAACLVGWILDTIEVTKGKRDCCICYLCSGPEGRRREDEDARRREQEARRREQEQEEEEEQRKKAGMQRRRGQRQRGRREEAEGRNERGSSTSAVAAQQQQGEQQQQQEQLCLLTELWRALVESHLLHAIVQGLLVLDQTMPPEEGLPQGAAGGDGVDGGDGADLAAAVRRAYADQLQLAEAANTAFSVRPDRGILARNLAWMPHGLSIPPEACPSHQPARELMASLSCQLALSAGLVAATGAAGACTTYGMQPGAVVALAGEVMPCLWECEQGGQAAVRGSRQLLDALDKRLKVWASVVYEGCGSFPDLPVRLGGITDAGCCLVHLPFEARPGGGGRRAFAGAVCATASAGAAAGAGGTEAAARAAAGACANAAGAAQQ